MGRSVDSKPVIRIQFFHLIIFVVMSDAQHSGEAVGTPAADIYTNI